MDVLDSTWSAFSNIYDPLKAGSIDGTDTIPHDKAVERAMEAKYKPNKGVVGDPLRTIIVTRLSRKTDETSLTKVFAKYGKIKHLRLVRDIITGFSKGYAFIEYSDGVSADRAYRNCNRKFLDEKEILVDYECERKLKGWIPRRLGGGFGGRKESGQLRFGGRDRPFKKPISLLPDGSGEGEWSRHRWRGENRERNREGDRRRDRDRGGDREGHRDGEGGRDREGDRDGDRRRDRDRDRHRHSDRHRDKHKDKYRERDRERERDRDRSSHSEKEREGESENYEKTLEVMEEVQKDGQCREDMKNCGRLEGDDNIKQELNEDRDSHGHSDGESDNLNNSDGDRYSDRDGERRSHRHHKKRKKKKRKKERLNADDEE